MHSLRHIVNLPVLLIYFTFIQSQRNNLIWAQDPIVLPAALNSDPTISQQSQTTESDLLHDESFSDRDKKEFIDKSKDVIFKKLLGIKDMPSNTITTTNTKFYVPRAILEKYMKFRDEVRNFIPDDRDFFGKLDVDGLEDSHEKFWNEVYDRSGSYDLEVDMKPPDEISRDARLAGDHSHTVVIRLARDPEEVPPNIERVLPPHVTSVRHHKQYHSVHLKFNLSQRLYTQMATEEDFTGAHLHLTRDKISGSIFKWCDGKRIPELVKSSDFDSDSMSVANCTDTTNNSDDGLTKFENIVPRYQRVFLLLITGYDAFNEPMTTIIDTQRSDSTRTHPIVLNIGAAVRRWLEDASTNHGVILRVTNDDEDFERLLKLKRAADSRYSNNRKRELSKSPSNASDPNIETNLPERTFLEQIRLKRGFGQASDGDEIWLKKQPYITAYSKQSEPERHVKRHAASNEDDTEGMQADDPGSASHQHASTSTMSSYDTTTQTDKPYGTSSQSSTHESVTKRDHIPTVSSSRRGQPMNRPLSNGRASSPQQGASSQRPRGKGKPSIRQADKCSKKTLKINFDEVGWSSWIIAPQSYYTNYCSGECTWPLSDMQNSTNHAIIQAIYHSVGRVVPKSCCGPTKLAKMAILYQLDGIVQMRQYDDMIVEACGCL